MSDLTEAPPVRIEPAHVHLDLASTDHLGQIVAELRRALGIEDGLAPTPGTVDLEAARRATVTLDHLAALDLIGATS